MENQAFKYGVKNALTANAFKIVGKRFVSWNTAADGTGTVYAADYSESKMTAIDGATVTLYAQWVDCTHNTGEYRGTVTYSVNGTTIIEACDCGRTASVTLSAVNVYHDGNPHHAMLTYSETPLLCGNPTVTYTKDGESFSGIPTDVGKYKASITVAGKTVTVEYEIKSPSAGTTTEAIASAGQKFGDFSGVTTVKIPANGTFTAQFSVWKLDTDQYGEAPKLTFSTALPSGTRIIMVTGGKFYHCTLGESLTELAVTAFTQMGGSTPYSYRATKNQTFRFIFDFSDTALTANTTVTFTYPHTSDPIKPSVTVNKENAAGCGISVSGNELTVTADAQDALRWQYPNLILKLTATKDLPGDVSLTVVTGGETKTVYPSGNVFHIPLKFEGSQKVSLKLNSVVAPGESDYTFTVELFAGKDTGIATDVMASANIGLSVAADKSPSLKITGDKHLVSTSDTVLPLTVEMKNTDGYTVSATIKRKNGNDYDGNYLSSEVTTGQNNFSLGGITEKGSYCLIITVSSSGQTVMQVPYYFIVN